jgi:CDGSH-type Zn-finger protein
MKNVTGIRVESGLDPLAAPTQLVWLVVWFRSLLMTENAAPQTVVRLRDNGPLVIEGPVKIVDAEGHEFVQPAGKAVVALCRCGQSQRKPFCDGSHKACGFLAADRAG